MSGNKKEEALIHVQGLGKRERQRKEDKNGRLCNPSHGG